MASETTYLPTKKVLQRYGISAMTLWRWEHAKDLPFPSPLVVNRRKFYELPKIEAWEQHRAAGAKPTISTPSVSEAA